MGTSDGFTSVAQLQSRVEQSSGTIEVELVDHVGHFELESPVFDDRITSRVHQFIQKHVLALSSGDAQPRTSTTA